MAIYIGITLGPISDTMLLTSSPAGLWAASYLFSFLAHEIREKIGKDGLVQDDLEYEFNNEKRKVSLLFEKGVGLYHDRIIYEADDDHSLEGAIDSINNSVKAVVEGFLRSDIFDDKDKLEDFFKSYFNIHALCIEIKEEENFLLKVNDALDAAELEKNFPSTISSNPILALFDGNKKGRNEEIKKSFLVSKKEKSWDYDWVLSNKSEKGIKDLNTIASCSDSSDKNPYNAKDKAAKYYAVIRADGDNMGKTIKENIKSEGDYIDFSKRCFRYGCNTAEIVLKHGGIPIYVGGDDLLCIAPLMCLNDDGKKQTFLEMIKQIREEFKKEFPGDPDLSFGVQIQYVRAPLYEALEESGGLLFGTAKNNKPGALAVNLRKHSGQSAQILIKDIGSEKGRCLLDTVNDLIIKHADEETLKSVGRHISDFAPLFNEASKNYETIDNFFANMFDNEVKAKEREYIDQIRDLAKILNDSSSDKELEKVIDPYIRIIKFFSEEADREEVTE